VFLTRSVQRGYEEDNWGNRVSSVRKTEKKGTVGREPLFRKDLSAEAEDSPLLAAVTRERLVKTQEAGKSLAGAVVICELRRLAVALYLLVVPSSVYEWSINPTSNPKPRQESLHARGNIKMDRREIGWCGMDWIYLTQDRYQWRALLNTVMNLRVP
jgi:hypothetical protein